MSNKPTKVSENFYTSVAISYDPTGQQNLEKQSVFDLVAADRKELYSLLNRRGFHSLVKGAPGSLPVRGPCGEEPDHDKDPAAWFAEHALLLLARFKDAWTSKKYGRAAEYAYIAGQYRGFAVMHDRKGFAVKKSKTAKQANAADRHKDIVCEAVQKCVEKGRRCSITDLLRWLKPGVEKAQYYDILRAGNFRAKVAEALASAKSLRFRARPEIRQRFRLSHSP